MDHHDLRSPLARAMGLGSGKEESNTGGRSAYQPPLSFR